MIREQDVGLPYLFQDEDGAFGILVDDGASPEVVTRKLPPPQRKPGVGLAAASPLTGARTSAHLKSRALAER
ncbi:MAG: hypothetical protein U0235_12325 [Polyangiaceae bacterium]